jgi:hypothetical protein
VQTVFTASNGKYLFTVSGLDSGTYKITANLTGGVPSTALNCCDMIAAGNISTPPVTGLTCNISCISIPGLNMVYQKLAADVNRDRLVNQDDVTAIANKINSNVPFGRDWTFVDSLNTVTTVTPEKFFEAKEELTFFLRNYNREKMNFTGMVYGDVDGSALPPVAGSTEANANLRTEALVKSEPKIPEEFFLSPNYPNPFNPTTRIEYGLPKDERVRLQIFNVVGQLVYTCVDQTQKAGYYKVDWNGIDQIGQAVPAGVYLMRLQAGTFSQVRKLALVK